MSSSSISIKKQKFVKFIKELIKKREYISYRELADIFGISKSTVNRWLIDYDLYDEYLALKENDFSEHAVKDHIESELKYWKKKYYDLRKEIGLESQLIELFEERIPAYTKTKKPSLNIKVNNTPHLFKGIEEPVLILSDIHYGGNVNSEETLNLNEYNTEIAKERLLSIYEHFINTVIRIEDGHLYKTCNLWLLGDIVEGIIHDELIGDVAIVDQVLEIAELISEIVYDLSQRFDNVEIVGVVGNHGRVKQKVHFKQKYSNFDYLVYKFIETRCKNLDNVSFMIPKSSMCIVNKFGKFNFLLRHGDGKSYSYAGIPVYGIIRQSSKIQQSMSAYKDIYIHYEILGHYHSNMSLPKPNGSIIVAGSLKGIDEYSFNNFMFNEPSQTMLIINESDGLFARIDLKPDC